MTAHEDAAIETAEKMAKVVELRRQRLTFDEIGERLGHSRQWVHELYHRALSQIPAPEVEQHRHEMLDQLDEAERAVLGVLHAKHVVVSNGHVVSQITGHHPDTAEDGSPHPSAGQPIYGDPLVDDGPILDAARTLVTIQARKSRLLGADAPAKVETDLSVLRYEVVNVDPADLI